MSKKYNDVRINSIERNMKNNPLEYLDYINKNKNEEEILPASIILRNTAPSPTKCCCPTYSSSVRGRILSAKGSLIIHCQQTHRLENRHWTVNSKHSVYMQR